MKLFWKIIIGAAVFSTVLAFILYLHMVGRFENGSSFDISSSKESSRDASAFTRVDQLLNEMETGAVAFNVPTNINIDDSALVQLILSIA